MKEYDLPFTLKICYAFFFVQGAFGMLISMIVWLLFDISLTSRIVYFLFLVGYVVLNIEIGKGLKRIKKWAYISAIILCLIQTILVLIGYEDFSLFTIFSIVVVTLLLTLTKHFWIQEESVDTNKYIT